MRIMLELLYFNTTIYIYTQEVLKISIMLDATHHSIYIYGNRQLNLHKIKSLSQIAHTLITEAAINMAEENI